MRPAFVHETLPARVLFGHGTLARLDTEMRAIGIGRALVLSTAPQAEQARRIARQLGTGAAGVFDGAVMHTPVEVTLRALERLRESGADGLVAIGGGSTTGLGKALSLRTGLPHLCVPTTYAGSEMTPILGETKDGLKTTQRAPAILPRAVIYDVDLTLTLPPAMSVTSGMNAVAHSVEALYAQDASPIVRLMAVEGIAALGRAMPAIVARPDDALARWDALYGAWLSGACLGAVGMALHHKLCHTLGGSFDLPHAETHTVVLPHAIAYNEPAAPAAMAKVASALGVPDAARGLWDLAGRLGAPRSLEALGMPEAGIARAAELTLANPYWNPRPLERAAIEGLLRRAWAGLPPEPG